MSTIIPQHVAIVMDGNGRWAKKRLLPRAAGHKMGKETVRRVIESAIDSKISVLTLFAFSTENWSRPEEEVTQLMEMFLKGLDQEVPELHSKGIRLRFIGDRARLNIALQEKMAETEEKTLKNTRLQLVIAVNYGGQQDMIEATRLLYKKLQQKEVTEITSDVFQACLYTQDLPPVDLFIRTSGEIRISNFLLWQIAYAELYFTEVLWPDFDAKEWEKALDVFAKRQRRFGSL